MSVLDIVNEIGCPAFPGIFTDSNGCELLAVTMKATFDIRNDSKIVVADEQSALKMEGEYNGNPGTSSLRYEPEATHPKTSTDVILIGHAWAPKARSTQVDVSFRVGRIAKTVRVFGDRYWTSTFGFFRKTSAKTFETIPLVYERAFGGWDRTNSDPHKHVAYTKNPVGLGYHKTKPAPGDEELKLPNLEDPRNVITSPSATPEPAGFGFVSPDWEYRAKYGGTYDSEWMKSRMPMLPKDFNQRFFNSAHPDLVSDGYLRGNESVEVKNASSSGHIRFHLPAITPPIINIMFRKRHSQEFRSNLDSVIVNTDESKLYLIWRAGFSIHGKVHDVSKLHVHGSLRGGA
jgi:hypothetical protein